MNRWLIPISGFTQTLRRPTGFETLWRHLRRLSDSERVITTPLPWDHDWRSLAEFIRRQLLIPDPTDLERKRTIIDPRHDVRVFAYSWGAGWGFTKLAESLRGRGICVRFAVLADPVYRSPWLPDWLPANPLSMTRLPRIEVPRNVREIAWTRQRRNRPCGHDLIAQSKRTVIHDCIELDLPHAHMDDAAEFHDLALRYAEAA